VGLDLQRTVALDSIPLRVATRQHRALARDIARRAVTLVRNENQIIPLVEHTEGRVAVLVLTDAEDNRTDIHRPGPRSTTEAPGTYFVQQLQRRIGPVQTRRLTPSSSKVDLDRAMAQARASRLVIMPVSLRMRTTSDRVRLPENLEEFVAELANVRTPVVVVLLGNPYVLPSFGQFPGVLCAYGDAEPLLEASVEALMGEIAVSGKLPVKVSDRYALGTGISVPQSTLRLADRSTTERDPERFRAIDELVQAAIADSAFPAAQVAVVHHSSLI
jgi:hypothetical protein